MFIFIFIFTDYFTKNNYKILRLDNFLRIPDSPELESMFYSGGGEVGMQSRKGVGVGNQFLFFVVIIFGFDGFIYILKNNQTEKMSGYIEQNFLKTLY